MKKITTLLSILIISFGVSFASEDFSPFFENGKYWRYEIAIISITGRSAENTNEIYDEPEMEFKIEGDTVINDMTYHKCYAYTDDGETPDNGVPIFFLRETKDHDAYYIFNKSFSLENNYLKYLEFPFSESEELAFSVNRQMMDGHYSEIEFKEGSYKAPCGEVLRCWDGEFYSIVEGIGVLSENYPLIMISTWLHYDYGPIICVLYPIKVTGPNGEVLYEKSKDGSDRNEMPLYDNHADKDVYYDMMGRKFDLPQKGVNILIKSDGSCSKILVK